MDLKWIKLYTDMFDNKKIKLIKKMPSGDTMIVIWCELLCLAGTANDSGALYLTKELPYNDEMLATAFDRPINTVRLALETFKKFKMIDIKDNTMYISNWIEYQNIEGIEKIREQNRIRQKNFYDKRKKEIPNVSPNVIITQPNAIEEEIDIDKEYNSNNISYNSLINNNSTIHIVPLDTQKDSKIENSTEKKVFDFWNNKKIVVHKTYTEQLEKLINNKIKFYGLDKIYMAIDNYSKIYNDKNYFFSYKWTLKEFLSQSNALPEFLEDGSKWLNYKNRSKNGKISTYTADKEIKDVARAKNIGEVY